MSARLCASAEADDILNVSNGSDDHDGGDGGHEKHVCKKYEINEPFFNLGDFRFFGAFIFVFFSCAKLGCASAGRAAKKREKSPTF